MDPFQKWYTERFGRGFSGISDEDCDLEACWEAATKKGETMNNWTKDDFNSIRLIGRATKDFETRFTSSGVAITSGSIATGGGKKKDGTAWPTEFFDLKAFGRDGDMGEALADVKKGDTVFVKRGRLVQERWDDKETGKPRSKVVVKVEELEIVKPKSDGSVKGHTPEADDDTDIPF